MGEQLYAELQDNLFGVIGTWRLARCSEPRCGLIWLDPMPLSEDIGDAYASYYTHASRSARSPRGLVKQTYDAIKRDYLALRYGYHFPQRRRASIRPGWLLYLIPIRRSNADEEVRHLRAQPGGRLLDVGCGSGDWISDMRELGWQVTGVDFDAAAVAVATRRGLHVVHGSLEAQRYADESFDAIMLNHVIEHVPDPVVTLAECRRILKRGGQLMIFTPNSASLGHRIFKEAWRGLEPPRHLHLFCPSSMHAALSRAGFTRFDLRTVNSEYMWRYSVALSAGRGHAGQQLPVGLKAASLLLTLLEQAMLVLRPVAGECLAIRVLKP